MSHILLPVPFVPILQKEYADILQLQFNKASGNQYRNKLISFCCQFISKNEVGIFYLTYKYRYCFILIYFKKTNIYCFVIFAKKGLHFKYANLIRHRYGSEIDSRVRHWLQLVELIGTLSHLIY
jgi:hypothetical protein